ncbi:MAG: helix-turn-helix domain-containing protein [Reichenbachiella sp.]|uniref:helix-turn-helix domain-containing protein n=1 Tax=Reichenbachiella sp. TaxID=2184521 RepID=UPI003263B00D
MLIANITAITLLLVFAIALWITKRRAIADIYLMLIIFTFTAYLVSDIWVNLALNRWSFAFHNLTSYLMFLPFFFYAMLLITGRSRIKKSWLWFTLFHVAFAVFAVLDIFILNDYSNEDIRRTYLDPPWMYHFFYKGLHLYIIGAMIWFLFRLRHYQRKIKDFYSNVEDVKLDWIKYFAWIYIIIYSTSLITFLLLNIGLISDIKIPYLLISVLMVISLFGLIYKGIKQYAQANFAEVGTTNTEIENEKYTTSSLSDQAADELFDRIQQLFKNENIFHNPELKVQDIAEKLAVTNHNISQVLNQKAEKTFYEFVNSYRLDYFKELLADPEKRRFTILALGMESGFNSKASLNRVFKQQLGLTPREYQQSTMAS